MSGDESGFAKRQEGFEKRFAYDEHKDFKIAARRNKLLGLWAAEKLNLTGAGAESYAKEVVKSDLEEEGDEDVFRKVRGDFDKGGVECSDRALRAQMDALMDEARKQIEQDG